MRNASRSAGVVLLLALFELAAVAAQSAPPNVVMIISDDQAWTDFGFMGHADIRTPHLDELASESLVFTRGYVPTSLCRPSLATLISGLYPHQHRIVGNDPLKRPGTSREDMLRHIRRIPKLPELLGRKGYVSHQSGKWWEGSHWLGGFNEGMTHGDPRRGGRHGDEGLKIGREGMQPVLDFIDRSSEKPFFVWYAPFLPHTPHNPPKRLLKKYVTESRPVELSRYYAMCEWFDETCGELLAHLDERGLAENTLVVFVTDNGWIQRTTSTSVPDDWRFRFAPKSKRSPYDGGLRTPIMLRWPGRIRAGMSQKLVSSVDLAPTILAAAGLEPAPSMRGINLLNVGNKGKPSDRAAIFGATYSHDVPEINNPSAGLQYRWSVSGRWKLIVPRDNSAASELYDIVSDPHEVKNLAGSHAEVIAQMTKLIDDWWPARSTPES